MIRLMWDILKPGKVQIHFPLLHVAFRLELHPNLGRTTRVPSILVRAYMFQLVTSKPQECVHSSAKTPTALTSGLLET